MKRYSKSQKKIAPTQRYGSFPCCCSGTLEKKDIKKEILEIIETRIDLFSGDDASE
jgi:hypothetical protein